MPWGIGDLPPEAVARADAPAQAARAAGTAQPEAALDALDDPDPMPPNLSRVHRALDRAAERLYFRSGFVSKRERVEQLFVLFERTGTPLRAGTKEKSG